MRTLALCSALLAAGCSGKPAPAVAPTDGIDFAGWPAATPEPVSVHQVTALLCAQPLPEQQAGLVRIAPADIHGPHAEQMIVVRVSPAALADFLARRPLAPGSTVVKEKHPRVAGADGKAGAGPMTGYTAMVKREAGYDPAGGDWEYVDATRGPAGPVLRGSLSACAACHAGRSGSDHLFRDYLLRE